MSISWVKRVVFSCCALILLVLLFASNSQSAQTMYKCTQSDGSTVYGVEKCPTAQCLVDGLWYPHDSQLCIEHSKTLAEEAAAPTHATQDSGWDTLTIPKRTKAP